ncbi:calcium/sodium antiporter [Fulvimarina sp. MAC3]|uniref:calcium/sodium antiporter n=1 Tax=Fulvimarina sp. MAC3 TaxID=3148887 RepID=UPI0031FC9834
MQSFIFLIAGLVLLIVGGELLVRGSVKTASRLGVSPLVIGLTLVGFGTSTPELVTSVQASLSGAPGIAIGNIVGSNIANLLLILGVSALLAPIAVKSSSLRRDGGVLIAVSVGFAALAVVWPLDRFVGAFFVLLLVAYMVYAFRQERVAGADHGAAFDKAEALQEADTALRPEAEDKGGGSILLPLLLALAGLALVVFGGILLVDGAVAIARDFGISETVIGLTIVAIGTSMPELVTSITAAIKKQSDVAFGNVIGSNIYNILGIGGFTGLISPVEIPDEIIRFDNPIMVAVTVLAVVFAWSGGRIGRVDGMVLLTGYAVYMFVLWP